MYFLLCSLLGWFVEKTEEKIEQQQAHQEDTKDRTASPQLTEGTSSGTQIQDPVLNEG
jgi:hypothetical protein